jgi:para-aminobenzoate synthetase component I
VRGYARFAEREGREPVDSVDLTAEPDALCRPGVWFVVAEFDGPARAWRFADTTRASACLPWPTSEARARTWQGPALDEWTTSLDRTAYTDAVRSVRESVREGGVYQANICRVLSAPLPHPPDGAEPDAIALAQRLAAGNPAPFQGAIHVPHGTVTSSGTVEPVWVVSASPELFLRIDGLGQPGPTTITSGPIKGTARTPDGLLEKDEAENVMITDLVRNDLQRVCVPGTVAVTRLLGIEHHPGLVHLVSTVSGELLPELENAADVWRHILAATFPPASVSGAPKSSALRIIKALETAPRGPYCGAIGWVDSITGSAELAVGIRTFWWSDVGPAEEAVRHDGVTGSRIRDGRLHFGTGAGITWGSEPEAEWAETELKASRLIALASTPRLGT